MKRLLAGILAIGSLTAQSAMLEVNGHLDSEFYQAELSNSQSYYEKLGILFAQGKLPNLSKISNIAWSGRCFSPEKPNDPTNAGYIFRQKNNSDAGPLRQNVKVYEAFTYWKYDQAPNYYDNMSIELVFATHPKIKAHDAKIESNQISINLTDGETSRLRVSGSYLIEELQDMPVEGPLGNKTTYSRCYYFIPDLDL